jgi:chorismate mutase / prephenate dehydratase
MENMNVAYLGPKGTFSQEAAIKYFGENNSFTPLTRIDDVFRKVINNEAHFGIVPIENSVTGTIVDAIDLFITTKLKIYDEVSIEIRQNLLSNNHRESIKKIYSHASSLGQCSKYLIENFPKAEYIEITSNAKAAMLAKEENDAAAIGPALCAKEYGLKIIEESINDFKHNETKFFIISNAPQEIMKEKSMIIFSVLNKPGSLYNTLKVFKQNKINMTKIESRPSKIKKWDYVFIVEYENIKDNKKTAKLLSKMEKLCGYFNYLGSY